MTVGSSRQLITTSGARRTATMTGPGSSTFSVHLRSSACVGRDDLPSASEEMKPIANMEQINIFITHSRWCSLHPAKFVYTGLTATKSCDSPQSRLPVAWTIQSFSEKQNLFAPMTKRESICSRQRCNHRRLFRDHKSCQLLLLLVPQFFIFSPIVRLGVVYSFP